MTSILKIIPSLVSWAAFAYVIFFVEYPKSLTQASVFQLLAFFIPLSFALPFTIDLILGYFIWSALISLGIIIMLILKALDSLNLVTAVLTIIALSLLLTSFKPKKNLTSGTKIPRLKSFRR